MAYINGNEILFSCKMFNGASAEEYNVTKKKIEMMGGSVEGVESFGDIPNAIETIPVGNSSYERVQDCTPAYQKGIAVGVSKYIAIKKIGGATYKDGDMIKSAKVTEVKSNGANMLNFALAPQSTTTNGVTFTNNGDGSITVKGKASAQANYYIHQIAKNNLLPLKENINYTVSGVVKDKVGVCIYDENWKLVAAPIGQTTKTFSITDDSKKYGCYLFVNSGTEVDAIIYPMLNVGSEAAPFKPYNETVDALPIPTEIQAIEGYGESNPDDAEQYNYIDFERRKFVAFGHIVDGAWVAFDTVRETDVSSLISCDNLLTVEGGGVLTMVNEHGFEAPNEITYTKK